MPGIMDDIDTMTVALMNNKEMGQAKTWLGMNLATFFTLQLPSAPPQNALPAAAEEDAPHKDVFNHPADAGRGYEKVHMEYQYESPWRAVMLTHLMRRFNQKAADIEVAPPTVHHVQAINGGYRSQFSATARFPLPWIIQPVRISLADGGAAVRAAMAIVCG
eukprot:SAG11_NODE_6887_length_1231_cov_1.163428_2_plen_162_part_00